MNAVAAALVAAVVALVVLAIRHRTLAADVRRILKRLGMPADAPVPTRALYRGVRELERRAERAEGGLDQLRAALDGGETGVLLADARGRRSWVSRAAVALVEGTPGTAARVDRLLVTVAESGRSETLEVDVHEPVRRILRVRADPVPGGVVAWIEDLTERRRLEAMRRDFVANAGHELKTPLGALSALAEAMASAGDDETRRRLGARVAEEVSRMVGLVDDILELASIEAQAAKRERVDLDAVAADAADRVAVRAAEAGVEVVVEPSGGATRVEGVRDQLVSAMVNLLSNAIRHSERSATVWLRVRVEGDAAVVEVEDHGVGIAPEHQERIFERFYRIDRARHRASGGTGLGLSIVRNVAREHGGEVTVVSTPGEGSTFRITLPQTGGG